MSDFMSVLSKQNQLDPLKRVKYTKGLVLGVDEFDQEQFYLMDRDRIHNRALHGYGTICGLEVTAHGSPSDPVVMVSAGLAVDCLGQMIRVPSAQCAHLNAWLERHKDTVLDAAGPLPSGLPLYVVLSYRECDTDTVPIPGEPCRTEDESMAPSRITDYFDLSLKMTPPPQVEEYAVRCFGRFLRGIEITALPGSFITKEEMEELVRGLVPLPGSPPVSSPPCILPSPGEAVRIHPNEAYEILNAAFRVWVTEVRPFLLDNCQATGSILLARLDFEVAEIDGNPTVEADVTVNQENRPILLHSRLLQEWWLPVSFSIFG